MINIIPKNWWQIEIDEIENTSGKDVILLLDFIIQFININYIVLDYIHGALGKYLYHLKTPVLMSLKKTIKNIKPAPQFEFGNFYLFEQRNNAEKFKQKIENIKNTSNFNQKIIADPDTFTSVSVFDNTSFIIYTKNTNLVKKIKEKYPKAKIENKKLSELEFYY